MALSKFILELKTEELQPAISQAEVDDIENGVNEFVKHLTDEVAKEEKLFIIKKIHKVGSFYEKTKVGNPNEFDFLLELDGKFRAEKQCGHFTCSAHVNIDTPVSPEGYVVESMWTGKQPGILVISPEGYLLSGGAYSLFKQCIFKVLNKKCKKDVNQIQCKMGHLFLEEQHGQGGPNVEFDLQWRGTKQFAIGIDLSISIPCTDELLESWKDELVPLDLSILPRPLLIVPSQATKRSTKCRVGYISEAGDVVSHELCWKISTTPIEVEKMRNLPEPYRLCYLVLKWMCKVRHSNNPREARNMITLSSYMLKNAVLCCQAHNEQKETANCLEQVLQYLCACADKHRLPAYFMPKANLWRFAAGKAAPPIEILGKLIDYPIKTLEETSPENVNFKHVRARINCLQRQFSKIESEALRSYNKPKLALPSADVTQPKQNKTKAS